MSTLGRSRIENDAVALNLRPSDVAKFTKPGSGVVAKHHEQLEMVGKSVPKPTILVMLQKARHFAQASVECGDPW